MILREKRKPYAWLMGLLLASASAAPSYAVDNLRREVHHFFECLGMMLSAPPEHKENCQPNRVPGPFGSIQSTGGNGQTVVAVVPVAVPVAVPVVEPPPPPPAPDPCACGSCYAQ